MSGPKKSHWEIRQEIIAQRRAQKRAKRERQIEEIEGKLKNCRHHLEILEKEYGSLTTQMATNVNIWMQDIKSNIQGDLRECFRGIKGIESYLSKQKTILTKKKREKEAQQQKEQKILEEKMLREAKINAIVESLEAVEHDYAAIFNEGIKQRVELFKNAIKTNPDNQNTLKQIKQFQEKLFQLHEAHKEQEQNSHYVAETFANILDAQIEEKNSEITISGAVDGVPISVTLHNDNDKIDFDTPLDGSCKKAMDRIQKELQNANINLGAIQVVKTGQILNKSTKNTQKQKVHA